MPDMYDMPAASDRLMRSAALGDDVSRLPFVSGKREEALRRLGIQSVESLLLHIPHRYLDFSRRFYIEDAPLGEVCTVIGSVDRIVSKPHARIHVTEVSLIDETGVLQLAFFKQPWLSKQLSKGDRLAVMGKVEFNFGFKQMASPHYEKLDDAGGACLLLPVHYVSDGASVAWMRRIVSRALEHVGSFADPLPVRLRVKRGLMSLARAYRSIHFPSSMGEKELARRRLAYDETLYLQLGLRLRNDANLLGVAPVAHTPGEHVEALRQALPFTLSDEQDAAVADILHDMSDSSHVMNRLLLGDVGTGKTAVASVAVAACADTGTQACIMAPTSVLAQQYAVKCGPLLQAAGITWALLTGATPASERSDILARLTKGAIDVLFGTHAVLSDDVHFNNLSLAVIDEQHRFGVGQRNALRAKGLGADLLVMTATPIPRTLALSVYGDLDTSIIKHRPVAGAGVTTKVLTDSSRDVAYGAVRTALAEGHQVYVVCPLVAPSDSTDELDDVPGLKRADDGSIEVPVPLHDAETEAARLQNLFRDAKVGVLHGRMSARDKEATIDAFRNHRIDVLVSTTVIEVGVDVPNANTMIIENAERFGLATLHQLRGRVGRGSIPGTCFVITHARGNGARSSAQERLESLEKTQDGFALAEMDLRLRHEGDILGFRQSGGITLRFVDLDADAELIEWAHRDAIELLRYAHDLDATVTLPLKHEVIRRYGDVFKEVSGG